MTVPVPPAARVTSRQHAVVRRCREIARRGDPDVVLIDGEHLLAEALACAVPVEVVLTDGRAPEVAARAAAAGARLYQAGPGVIEAASPVRTPSGIVALARWSPSDLSAVFDQPRGCWLGLVGVQDPGNAGSAIRAADALGAAGVLALDHTADPRNWKTLRGTMGSAFRVPIARGSGAEAVTAARSRSIPVVACVAEGGAPVDETDLASPALLLLGSEGAGLSATALAGADRRITVPMRSGVDSLNVAATAAIVLFEARRQRRAKARAT